MSGRGHSYCNVKGEETLRAAVEAGDLGKPKAGPYVGRGLALGDRGDRRRRRRA